MEAEEQRRQMSPEGEGENEAFLSLPCGRQKIHPLAYKSTPWREVMAPKRKHCCPLVASRCLFEYWLLLQPLKKTPLNLGATGEIYAVLFGAIPSPRGARAGEGKLSKRGHGVVTRLSSGC